MNIAILGAGFTGLAAAYQLTKKGYSVSIFEKDVLPGGLALGFKQENWDWSLEKHYHHWFTNDAHVLSLAKEIQHDVLIKRPKTSVYLDGDSYQLDSPLHVLNFPKLSFIERVRMGTVLGFLRYNPYWQPLENIKASKFLVHTMGKKAYVKLWEPQLTNKFDGYVDDISLAWFWARIYKRTASLAYPVGGFLQFANKLVEKIKQQGGKFYFNTEVSKIKSNDKVEITTPTKNIVIFDKAIVTLSSFLFTKIAPDLPTVYQEKLKNLHGLGASNMILRLKKQFLTDGTYWLSICDKSSPIMAVVEHTNFMDKKYYNSEHLVYLGNYLPKNHKNFSLTDKELLKLYDPFLRKINPEYQESLIDYKHFSVPFAQPIIPTNYSKIIPPFQTPLKNVFLANIQQVYPWDRGTNYAVELGEKVSRLISYQ